mmetsp:Transcript_29024/g.62658  ORF Transcript_29024/g.62658 Transcript_29024/m.62658 type:complete len:104 (+) Transcript_29024:358-669(+)
MVQPALVIVNKHGSLVHRWSWKSASWPHGLEDVPAVLFRPSPDDVLRQLQSASEGQLIGDFALEKVFELPSRSPSSSPSRSPLFVVGILALAVLLATHRSRRS